MVGARFGEPDGHYEETKAAGRDRIDELWSAALLLFDKPQDEYKHAPFTLAQSKVELDQTEHAIVAACSELQLIPARTVFGRRQSNEESLPPILKISNRQCDAILSLQGAQVLGFKPSNHAELLWLSPNAMLQSNKPVRGGIPVCLPWFGVNQQDPGKPKHGFARTSRWTLERASTDDHGANVVQLGLRQYATQPHPLFNFAFSAELSVSFGRQLAILLRVRNCSAASMPLSWALHSYHPVQDLEQLRILGLENTEYLDNTRQLQRFTQQGELKIRGEFDRVYLGVSATQTIMGTPGIRVSGSNAPSAVVWNPGAERAASMSDLGENTHRQFVCLERGAAFDNATSLAPQTTMQANITIEAQVAEREICTVPIRRQSCRPAKFAKKNQALNHRGLVFVLQRR